MAAQLKVIEWLHRLSRLKAADYQNACPYAVSHLTHEQARFS